MRQLRRGGGGGGGRRRRKGDKGGDGYKYEKRNRKSS
jgi:hypothetical protein